MSRTETLFHITQIIRSREYTTAAYLAARLGISVRTVYRYINDLSLSGIPVVSQTGKGYWLDSSFDMPPVQLADDELLALSLGARLVQSVSDPFLADAARQLVEKVESVIPRHKKALLNQTQIHAPVSWVPDSVKALMGELRQAASGKRKVTLHYCDVQQQASERTLWPLAIAFWGEAWTLAAWCELRQDFRAFRLDRISTCSVLKECYPDQPGRTLADFIAQEKYRLHPG